MISQRRKKTQYLFAIFWFYDFLLSGGIHDLDIEPEDIRGIFNDYTEEQVLASDVIKLPLPRFIKQKVRWCLEKLPLICMKSKNSTGFRVVIF